MKYENSAPIAGPARARFVRVAIIPSVRGSCITGPARYVGTYRASACARYVPVQYTPAAINNFHCKGSIWALSYRILPNLCQNRDG
eukprot:COSAG02_NODE_53288_length_302_cov_5.423645_1_plen_85_part_01